MKLSTLVYLSKEIESALGVAMPARITVAQMHAKLAAVAGHCRTKREAVACIAGGIYGHDMDDGYPDTDARLREIAG